MYQNIPFRGQSSNPSDYDCHDGELALSLNVIHEDGALRPIAQPAVLDRGLSLVYVHETPSYRNYIIQGNAHLYFITHQELNSHASIPHRLVAEIEHYRRILHIGNTLVILTDEGMRYYLYQDGQYRDLGAELPTPHLQLGLSYADEKVITLSADIWTGWTYAPDRTPERNREKEFDDIFNPLFAQLNPITRQFARDNEFCQPFLLRYALRLYDGSLIKHSAPILMLPTDGYPLITYLNNDRIPLGKEGYVGTRFSGAIQAYRLIAYTRSALVAELEQWGDIIRSVDVFVSAPIYTYSQDPQYTPEEKRSYMLFDSETQTRLSVTQAAHSSDWARQSNSSPEGHITVRMPIDGKIDDKIKQTSVFYHIASIPVKELSRYSTPATLPIEPRRLETLETQEVMTDDYSSHERIIPNTAFVYNNRLNISDLERRLFAGFPLNLTTAYTSRGNIKLCRAFVHLSENGRKLILESPQASYDLDTAFYYFFPNPNATKLEIHTDEGQAYIIPLQRHDMLHGAFAFVSLGKTFLTTPQEGLPHPTPASISERTIPLTGKIYTSEVNNPFLFPARSINTIGTGRILGLSSATKAISEGQYGQFPLYAFTTEGVWALSVDSTGAFSAKHPTTRDVCISPESITQTDTAVLFATDRGIMILSGSEARPISDPIINTPTLLSTLPAGDELAGIAGYTERQIHTPRLRDILPSCQMIYDYRHQRIILFRPATRADYADPAYVYSLRSGAWAVLDIALAKAIPSYPEALAISATGDLLDFSIDNIEDNSTTNAIILSRPFRIGTPDTYKTIRQLVPRGFFPLGAVKSALYGSEDYQHWELIASSDNGTIEGITGTPYKAFRIALIATLDTDKHAITGIDISYTPRFNSKIQG